MNLFNKNSPIRCIIPYVITQLLEFAISEDLKSSATYILKGQLVLSHIHYFAVQVHINKRERLTS